MGIEEELEEARGWVGWHGCYGWVYCRYVLGRYVQYMQHLHTVPYCTYCMYICTRRREDEQRSEAIRTTAKAEGHQDRIYTNRPSLDRRHTTVQESHGRRQTHCRSRAVHKYAQDRCGFPRPPGPALKDSFTCADPRLAVACRSVRYGRSVGLFTVQYCALARWACTVLCCAVAHELDRWTLYCTVRYGRLRHQAAGPRDRAG